MRAKSRLAARFGDAGRTELARALVEDALALVTAADFLAWWLVSDDTDVRARAAARGIRTVEDPGRGLNEAVVAATASASDSGATSVVVVAADLPLARAADLRDILDTGATSDIVVVPSDSGGTNALYMSPPGILAPAFGDQSLGAHARAAEAQGLRCTILSLPRLALDLDTPDDVDAFAALRPTGYTADALARLKEGREGS